MEAPSHPQVFIVGEEFIPGQAGNAEIDLMLGHQTVLCGDRAIRGDNGYELAPDYCADEALTREKLAGIGVYPVLLNTTSAASKPSKAFTQEWVAVIPFGDAVAFTKPLPTASEALASALWFTLADK